MQTIINSEEVQGTGIATQSEVSVEFGNKVLDVLSDTNLNWTVRKEDLISSTGLTTPNCGIFRNDTNAWLGTVSKKYTPYQNQDMVKTIVEASDYIGLNVSNGGELRGGKHVFIQLELPEEYIGKSNVKRYVTALNSHNGLGSVAFGSTNTVVVCQNSFYKAYKEIQKFRHHSSAYDKIKLAILELKNTVKEDLRLMETFKCMASLNVKDELIHKVVSECFAIDLDSTLDKGRSVKKKDSIIEALDIEQKLEGNTMWGLFNGVTRYTNHYETTPNKKNDHIMSGQGYLRNIKAYNLICNYIEKEHSELVSL